MCTLPSSPERFGAVLWKRQDLIALRVSWVVENRIGVAVAANERAKDLHGFAHSACIQEVVGELVFDMKQARVRGMVTRDATQDRNGSRESGRQIGAWDRALALRDENSQTKGCVCPNLGICRMVGGFREAFLDGPLRTAPQGDAMGVVLAWVR